MTQFFFFFPKKCKITTILQEIILIVQCKIIYGKLFCIWEILYYYYYCILLFCYGKLFCIELLELSLVVLWLFYIFWEKKKIVS